MGEKIRIEIPFLSINYFEINQEHKWSVLASRTKTCIQINLIVSTLRTKFVNCSFVVTPQEQQHCSPKPWVINRTPPNPSFLLLTIHTLLKPYYLSTPRSIFIQPGTLLKPQSCLESTASTVHVASATSLMLEGIPAPVGTIGSIDKVKMRTEKETAVVASGNKKLWMTRTPS